MPYLHPKITGTGMTDAMLSHASVQGSRQRQDSILFRKQAVRRGSPNASPFKIICQTRTSNSASLLRSRGRLFFGSLIPPLAVGSFLLASAFEPSAFPQIARPPSRVSRDPHKLFHRSRFPLMPVTTPSPRRSSRLAQLRGVSSSSSSSTTNNDRVPSKAKAKAASDKQGKGTRKRKTTAKVSTKKKTPANKTGTTSTTTVKKAAKKKDKDIPINSQNDLCLPRSREMELLCEESGPQFVMGIDEAGRGPLAGPVVAAAALVPQNISGVVDSKKLTKEATREELYEQIVASPNVVWAVAIVDAARIDEINILQATLEGMRMAATQVIETSKTHTTADKEKGMASASRTGCYVVCGKTNEKGEPIIGPTIHTAVSTSKRDDNSCWYALVDGNKTPKEMPCECESMVKGDSREYAIAAASILAKVTRDRLMHEYDQMYPQYELGRHKGYPTAAHMALVRSNGASPIHRRTFAPLKHMTFDDKGRIVEDSE